jgi:hypothetical protein
MASATDQTDIIKQQTTQIQISCMNTICLAEVVYFLFNSNQQTEAWSRGIIMLHKTEEVGEFHKLAHILKPCIHEGLFPVSEFCV